MSSSRSHYRTLLTGVIDLTADSDEEQSDKKPQPARHAAPPAPSVNPAAAKKMKKGAASSKPARAADKSASPDISETSEQMKKRLLASVFSSTPQERAAKVAKSEQEREELQRALASAADNQNNAEDAASSDEPLDVAEGASIMKQGSYLKPVGIDLTEGRRAKPYKVKKQSAAQLDKMQDATDKREDARMEKLVEDGTADAVWKIFGLPPVPRKRDR